MDIFGFFFFEKKKRAKILFRDVTARRDCLPEIIPEINDLEREFLADSRLQTDRCGKTHHMITVKLISKKKKKRPVFRLGHVRVLRRDGDGVLLNSKDVHWMQGIQDGYDVTNCSNATNKTKK